MRAGQRVASTRAARALLLALCASALIPGCGGENPVGPANVSRDPNVVVVYAACSFLPMMEEARAQFESENKGKFARVEGGEPSALAERIRSGAVPDLFVCPGEAEIGMLEREGFLDRGSRQSLGTLRLAIAVPADSAIAIGAARDLGTGRVRSIVMATPGITSLGSDAKRVLDELGIWSGIQDKISLQPTPLGALKQVAGGGADATVLYDPCFRLRLDDDVRPASVRIAVPLWAREERPSSVYIVAHKRSPNTLLAQRFIKVAINRGIALPAPLPPPAEAAGEQQD